ncbi:MAG: [protein-PII] uridylyltransferase [Pirellulales bacterium]
MLSGPHFRTSLLAAKSRLEEGRRRFAQQHERGLPGVQVCGGLTALVDEVIMGLFDAAVADLAGSDADVLRSQVALVPHGGYGRRHLSPYSDVDLMILHERGREADVAALAQRLLQDIFDVGLDLGQSVRTPQSACQLARGDAVILSSLVESRYLAGNESLYQRFTTRFEKMVRRRYAACHESLVTARREERIQYGETVYLLEPNIKRSRGALRDIHLLRWIGFAKFGSPEPDRLRLLGVLSRDDRRVVVNANEFLLRLRNEMHFHAQKAKDVLDRAEQVRVAAALGYAGGSEMLPVEQFMRGYFQHTSRVRYLVSRLVESVRPRPAISRVLGPVFSHQVEGDYRVSPTEISATKRGLAKLRFSLAEALRLMDLANMYDKRIAHGTWAAVDRAAASFNGEIGPDAAARFLSLLDQPARLAELLRQMHELGVLERIVPEFTRARCLLQFNEYHKYTVDEHCIRAVEHATEFAQHDSPLGRAYQQIKRKGTLHLALLLHDLGKGYPGDHSDVGLEIAQQTTARLQLPQREAEDVKFLVHKHLMMSHLAFRRDTSDDQLVVRFAVEVGSPELLRMLYVLTCADLAAVGPGVLNDWKIEVLTELYRRAMHHLAGDATFDSHAVLEQRRDDVRRCHSAEPQDHWFEDHVQALPASLLLAHAPEHVSTTLLRLRGLQAGAADAWGIYLPESQTVEFIVGVDQAMAEGVFHKLAGALTAKGLEILSAEINTLPDGLVLDRFVVQDPDYSGGPPADRLADVSRALVSAVSSTEPPKFRKVWGRQDVRPLQPLSPLPTRVRVDNSTSEFSTILDVFTFDRRGLLYAITRTLFELGLSVSVAKIGTYLDQVVDVFYVTDAAGQKIEDEQRLQEIRQRLLDAIDQ